MANPLLRAALVLGVAAAALEPFLFAGSFAGDAQVHLVFAESASHGRFFEFNPGERVSGETSPGYMLLEAVLFRACPPRVVPVVVKVLNLAGWYLFCFVVYTVAGWTLAEPDDDDMRTWAAVAAISAALVPGSVYNANVGMENGLFALIVWLWIDRAARWRWFERTSTRRPAREIILGALLGLASWFRPEAWLLATVVFAFQLMVVRPSPTAWIPAALSMILCGAGCVAFQYAYTGDIIATSMLSRRVLALNQQVSVGPLTIDPIFAKRLIVYAPLTVFSALGLGRGLGTDAAMLRFLRALLVVFFFFYTLAGAPQLGRYIIFLVPILAIGAARGARAMWIRNSRMARVALGIAAIWMVGIEVSEVAERRRIYSQRLLAIAMAAPANRRSRTNEVLREFGSPAHTPVAFAEEPIQQRYELDERITIRSLDGRTDRSIFSFVHDGRIDYLDYLKSEHVDFLAVPLDYDHRAGAQALAGLQSLAEGSTARRGPLFFQRLPSGRFAVMQTHVGGDQAGRP